MYQFKLEKFEGPLDLLLQLIEDKELDISELSLTQVTDQYLQYLGKNPSIAPEELADFLVVATKLLLLKSKLLLPEAAMDEEDEPESLEQQLKIYREYVQAMKWIEELIKRKNFLFWRTKPAVALDPFFSPGKDLTSEKLQQLFVEVVKGIEKLVVLPESVIERTISLQEKIGQLKAMIKEKARFSFSKVMEKVQSKTEAVISFLALLELVKRQEIHVHQDKTFGDIFIRRM